MTVLKERPKVKELPVLFKTPMVLAILALRKTMTRRVINKLKGYSRITDFDLSDTPNYDWHFRDKHGRWVDMDHAQLLALCPYGQVGERLWVKETWNSNGLNWGKSISDMRNGLGKIFYKATDKGEWKSYWGKWKSSLFMPRWASRILLEITDVRIERLQDISEADAVAEGIESVTWPDGSIKYVGYASKAPNGLRYEHFKPIQSFYSLWESINGRASLDANPWVWVISFRVVQGGDL